MLPAAVTIRRAGCEDIAAINALMQQSSAYQGRYRSILDGYQVTSVQIERDQVYVAVKGAELLGFYSFVTESPNPELDLLFVSDTAQTGGIGSALIAHLKQLAIAREIESIRIVSHPPAVGFYLHIGAEQVGTVPPQGSVTWERPLLTLRVTADGIGNA